MIVVRKPQDIFQVEGRIQNGTFHGRWHFSYEQYQDPEYVHFGQLKLLNDFTLSPGALFPLHLHRHVEIISYCAGGEFCHEDEYNKSEVLKKGWVQRTTVGQGMHHSVINNRQDIMMRFIQMWFYPSELDLEPSIEQKRVEKADRTDCFLPIVSNEHEGALSINSDAQIYSSFLQAGKNLKYQLRDGGGVYFYVIDGGPVQVNNNTIQTFGAAKIMDEIGLEVRSEVNTELLLIDVSL